MRFNKLRRQKFLREGHALVFGRTLSDDINRSSPKVKDPSLAAGPRKSYAWSVASNSLELFVLNYTAGVSLPDLQNNVPGIIEKFIDYVPFDMPVRGVARTLDITQQEAYAYIIWLLAICQLLGHAKLTTIVIGWLDLDREVNRGVDGLFESISERLTGFEVLVQRVLLYPEIYRSLARATVGDVSDRPALVAEFLKGWYKSMKPCYWHGTHSDKEGSSYFGYWSFEAALVTYLWDIDDSSYRDHLVYPKDMVDFARANFPYKGPWQPPRLRCEAGEPCPREGWWFTPSDEKSRRRFRLDETMPRYQSDYGETIWQWDRNQGQ